MAGVFQPPPTWAEPTFQGPDGKFIFNPVWLRWFIDLTKFLGTLGTSGSATGGNTTVVTGAQGIPGVPGAPGAPGTPGTVVTGPGGTVIYVPSAMQTFTEAEMAQMSLETLQAILIELRISNLYLQQLPYALNQGQELSAIATSDVENPLDKAN